jgi:hypothetical protein
MFTIYQEILNNDVSCFADQGVGVLEERCDQNDQGNFEYGMVLDDGVFAKGFRPEEIGFAENTTE